MHDQLIEKDDMRISCLRRTFHKSVWLLVGLSWVLPLFAVVPPPSETPAKIIVSGRTSTAVDIKIVKVGQEIPKTYAGSKIHNTPGFDFYVSEHYALKSSMDEAFSRMVLEMSELSYPQWVAMVGTEPPDPDTRMYLIYARSSAELCKAMHDDIGSDPGGFLGGFATYANRSAYNLPGGGLMYHRRGLVIHENLHMLNMVCNGTGAGEFMTYLGEQHVYDSAQKQLTVFCFDKAPINNYTEEGLNALRKDFIPMQEAVKRFWYGGGGEGSVFHLFFLTDPDRFLKWQIWRDEFYANRVSNESNAAIMKDIFGSLDTLNIEWDKWVHEKTNTFHRVTWGFEQEGPWLWSRPSRNNDYSRTDLNVIPGEVPGPDVLRMDYPRHLPPSTVGPIRRGPDEPAIGCELDLSKHVDVGRVGMAFGVEDEGAAKGSVKVVIEDGRRLVIDPAVWGQKAQTFELPEAFRDAVAADAHRLGMTVTIGRKALEVALRAKGTLRLLAANSPTGVTETFTAAIPLTPEQRERLLWRKVSLLSRLQEGAYMDLQFGIQPFLDNLPVKQVDLTKPASANRWGFAGLDRLETLYRASWRLKDQAPAPLLKLKAAMLDAVDKDPATQARATAAGEDRLPAVVDAVKACGGDPQMKAAALADLTGVVMIFTARRGQPPQKIVLETRLNDRIGADMEGTLTVSVQSGATNTVVATHPLGKLSRRTICFSDETVTGDPKQTVTCTATATLRWRGEPVTVTQIQTVR